MGKPVTNTNLSINFLVVIFEEAPVDRDLVGLKFCLFMTWLNFETFAHCAAV
jgi:hypothetical protein